MRALLGLIAIVLLLAVVGWITFSWNGDRASVNVETDKVERDTQGLVDEGRDLFEAATQNSATRDGEADVEAPPTAEPDPDLDQPVEPAAPDPGDLERRE